MLHLSSFLFQIAVSVIFLTQNFTHKFRPGNFTQDTIHQLHGVQNFGVANSIVCEVLVNLHPFEAILMIWEVCIRYANGVERLVRSYQSREIALKYVDALYKIYGYPLHFAYVVRPKYFVGPASAF